jgi:hypothetical protein
MKFCWEEPGIIVPQVSAKMTKMHLLRQRMTDGFCRCLHRSDNPRLFVNEKVQMYRK